MNELVIFNAVTSVLDSEIRPLLHFHGGDVHIAEISAEGVVRLEYTDGCHGCNLQVITHFVTVRERLLKVTGVTDVVALGAQISEPAKQRIAAVIRNDISPRRTPLLR
jgi:Fe-S cluster biogenesis protein NfuA